MEEGRSVVVSARSGVGGVRRLRAALKVEILGWGRRFCVQETPPTVGNGWERPAGGRRMTLDTRNSPSPDTSLDGEPNENAFADESADESAAATHGAWDAAALRNLPGAALGWLRAAAPALLLGMAVLSPWPHTSLTRAALHSMLS